MNGDDTTKRAKRIPSLDGLRALSILGVLMSHALSPWYESHPVPGLGALLTYGNLGVRVFFAVSGFLITSLLIREESATGGIALRAFYLRRTFRILPTYWTFLAVVFLFGPALPSISYVISWTFLSNYVSVPWPLGHSWSLAVEEQFYLLWPTLILLTAGRGRTMVVLLIWVAAPLFRLLLPLPWRNGDGIQNNLDSLMAGCFLAVRARELVNGRLSLFGSAKAAAASAALLLVVSPFLASVFLRRFPWIPYFAISKFVESVAIANVIWYCVNSEHTLLGRILNARAIVHVGVISYCLYLWQQPLLLRALDGASWTRVLAHLLLVFVVAELCHRMVEAPMIQLGRRLQRRWFGGKVSFKSEARAETAT
jgi:peptidoglycan/LPS O-acetylase OafA/YrhL